MQHIVRHGKRRPPAPCLESWRAPYHHPRAALAADRDRAFSRARDTIGSPLLERYGERRRRGRAVSWLLAAVSYLIILVVTVMLGTRGQPKTLLGRSSDQDAGGYETPDAIGKVVIVLYPVLLAFVAAIVWAVLWFGLYAVD
jgi:hypothetical protein